MRRAEQVSRAWLPWCVCVLLGACAGDAQTPTSACPTGMVELFESLCMDETPVEHTDYEAMVPDLVNLVDVCDWNESFDADLLSAEGGWVQGVDHCDAASYCAAVGKTLCGDTVGNAIAYDSIDDLQNNAWTRMCVGPMGTRTYPWGSTYDLVCTTGRGCPTEEGVEAVGTLWEWTSSCREVGRGDRNGACHMRTGPGAPGTATEESVKCLFNDAFLFDSSLPSFVTSLSDTQGVGFRCCVGK